MEHRTISDAMPVDAIDWSDDDSVLESAAVSLFSHSPAIDRLFTTAS